MDADADLMLVLMLLGILPVKTEHLISMINADLKRKCDCECHLMWYQVVRAAVG